MSTAQRQAAVATAFGTPVREIRSTRGLSQEALAELSDFDLRRLLAREKPEAANEFNTLKQLNSPNTWVAFPAGYRQFVAAARSGPDGSYRCGDTEAWRDALASSLSATSTVIPPVAKFAGFPWAAAAGPADPLRLEQVFDSRYFMASSELNLLNALLLGSLPAAEAR